MEELRSLRLVSMFSFEATVSDSELLALDHWFIDQEHAEKGNMFTNQPISHISIILHKPKQKNFAKVAKFLFKFFYETNFSK